MTEEIINLLNGLGGDWKKFLSILEESEQQLERDKVCDIFVVQFVFILYKVLLK